MLTPNNDFQESARRKCRVYGDRETKTSDDNSTVSPRRIPVASEPSPAEDWTTARGRSPGSRVFARVHLPEAISLSGSWDARSPVTVAGAAAGSNRVPFESFEIESRTEPCAYLKRLDYSVGPQALECTCIQTALSTPEAPYAEISAQPTSHRDATEQR
jgi:hypothetical protein